MTQVELTRSFAVSGRAVQGVLDSALSTALARFEHDPRILYAHIRANDPPDGGRNFELFVRASDSDFLTALAAAALVADALTATAATLVASEAGAAMTTPKTRAIRKELIEVRGSVPRAP